jgi:hypothetical protein
MADCLKGVPEEVSNFIKKAKDPQEALEQLKVENARRRKLTAMTQQAQKKLMGVIQNHPEGPEAGIRSIFANDMYGKATNSNVEYRQKALQGIAESYMPELKEKLSTTKLGFGRDKELGRDFIRAVFGDENVSDTAKRLAKEWGGASEFMRTRFNQYGGKIGKLEGYLPQSHDRVTLQKMGKQVWIEYIRPLLKNSEDLDLDFIYDTLATGGLNKVKEGAAMGKGKMIANKSADHRVLHFKDADSWIQYQEKLGTPDPLASIDDHIRRMTTDMSLIEIMGPNPKNMFESLKTVVSKEQVGKTKKGFDSYTEAIWNVVSGKVDNDLDAIGKLGTAMQTLRGVNTATMLGAATISAASDSASLFVNASYHGMNPFKTMVKLVKNLKVKNQEDAIRLGLGADVFNSEVTRRFSELGQGFWAKASEGLMRATGMNIWTEAGRKAFQTEFYHHLATLKKNYKTGKVPNDFQGRFTPDEFKKLNFDNLEVEQQIKILEVVQEQADYAVLMPTARVRAITTFGIEKGTGAGELARTGTQFQSFVLTFMQQHGARMFMQGTAGSRIAYGSSLIALTTLIASAAMTAKDMAKGYTPREGFDVTDEKIDTKQKVKFWSAALMQGGGMGIFGDLLFSDATRYGNSPIPTIAGPTSSVIEDAYKLTVGNIQEALDPDKENTHFGSEAVDFINRHANPTNTFYTKLLTERYIARNLKILLDEDYERTEARKLRKREREYGQEQFEWLQD